MKKLINIYKAWRARHAYAKLLAKATVEGHLWWSFNLPKDMVPMVFLPIAMGAKVPEWSVGCYGRDSEAIGTRGIDGYPLLSEAVFVNKKEAELVWKYCAKLKKKMKNL